MKRQLLSIAILFLSIALMGQQPLPASEIALHPELSASNMMAYPGPQRQLSPAPKGKKPFYLSHFGRHGSRYLTKPQDYDYVLSLLERASKEQKLSALGLDVLSRVSRLEQAAHNRLGDLTPLGAQEHRDIARRMAGRFPQVFRGDAVVDARSTTVMRSVLSMENTLQELLRLNPRLRISHDASFHDMYYLNLTDKKLLDNAQSAPSRQAYDEYCRRHRNWQRVAASLFNDTTYVSEFVNGERLVYYLFRLAGSVQDTELRHDLSLFDLFTPQELLDNWRMENAFWYLGYGHPPLNGSQQPYLMRNMLRRIIEQTDSCIALPRPGATLRFGHETGVLPLVCLMGLNGYDAPIGNLDSLELRGWVNYRIYPMSCNVQLVFYRHDPSDPDVLVKVLLNEDEATLPLPTSQPPYYRWADVRAYYLRKLEAYKEN